MSTEAEIQPVPELILASEFPTLADRPAGLYNQKAADWADSENAMVQRARETALVTHNNAQVSVEQAAKAVGAAEAAQLDAQATAEDRIATADDRLAVSEDRDAVETIATAFGDVSAAVGVASDKAVIATEQAGIATTKAGEATAAKATAQAPATTAVAARDSALLTSGTYKAFGTKALMDADLGATAGQSAIVVDDPDEDHNGWYYKTGASGSGGWEALVDQPASSSALSKAENRIDRESQSARERESLAAEFYGGPVFPYAAVPLADAEGNPLMAVEEDGRTHILYPATFYEFHNCDSELQSSIVDSKGALLIGWDDNGGVTVPGLTDIKRQEFHNDDEDVSSAIIGNDGALLMLWRQSGGVVVPELPSVSDDSDYLLPYVSGTRLRAAGADDVVAAELGELNAIATHAVSSRHVAAVIDRPSIGPTSAVAAARGLLIPRSEKVLHIVIGLGQSLMVGAESSNSLVNVLPEFPDSVLMFDRGDAASDVRMGLVTSAGGASLDPGDLIGFAPLVAKVGQGAGSRGQTPMESFANVLARDALAIGTLYRSLCFTAAIGGAGYLALKKGTQIYSDMLAALGRAKALADELGWSIIVDGCLVKHGEADSTSTNYLAYLLEWQADVDVDVRSITGQQAPVHFFLSQPSTFTTTSPRAAQFMLDAHNTSPVHHLVGSDYPFMSEYSGDYVHFTGPGYYLIGEQFARSWKQALWSAESKSQIVQITQAQRVGNEVTLKYSVPKPPLVFDTTTVSERDAKGFVFTDSTGPIAINDASITDDGSATGVAEIKLTLASTPSGVDETISYAMSPKSGADIPRGNVRDSDDLMSAYDSRPIYNWAVHQTVTL